MHPAPQIKTTTLLQVRNAERRVSTEVWRYEKHL